MSTGADEWYYQEEEKAVGPFTGDVIRQLRDAGRLEQDTLVARAGQDGWRQLQDCSLDGAEIPVPAPQAVPVPAARAGESSAAAPASPINPIPASVALGVFTLLGTIFVLSASEGLFGITALAACAFLVLWALLHHACWKALPPELRATTPGKAVGFMFIPLFNLYWVFVSYPKLAEGIIRWQKREGIPPVENLKMQALTYAVLYVCMMTLGMFSSVIDILASFCAAVVFVLFYKSAAESLNQLVERG